MAVSAPCGISCQLRSKKRPVGDSLSPAPDQVKIVLQPRLCTLRTYGSDRSSVIRTKIGEQALSPFLANLYEYIETTKRIHDFETLSGRLAMIVFAATMGVELATGNSVLRKMDLQGIEEAGGVCVGAVACSAVFAWLSSARNRVGRIFTSSANTFIDSLIDNIIDGLFYDSDLSDWTDEI